ncbi:MAG TPA: zinc ribbon domain-containing protein [Burkholderiaceae bacterium]|nr:zinc ribbon domain-containing protein [Burkholderiaceae bacterium]
MPIFDFHCPACGSRFEQLVLGTTVPACPQCGGTALQRQVSLVAPQCTAQATIAAGRRAAAREGHFSHYSAAERGRVK